LRRTIGLSLAGMLVVMAVPALGGNGDVDQNGTLDSADVLRLEQALRGERTLSPAEEAAADVAPVASGGGNGVDAADLGALIRALAGEDFDDDGLGVRTEKGAGTSPFSSNTDGDLTPDAAEDGDADGLTNADEQALGSGAGDASGVGGADPSFVPTVTTPTYPPGTGPTVLFYASRPSAYLTPDPVTGKTRLDPLKDLLEADGYVVADFTKPPLTDQYDTFMDYLGSCPGTPNAPVCTQYFDNLYSNVFVIVEPSEPISAAEGATLQALLGFYEASILVLSENGANVEAVGGAPFTGARVTHAPPSCPPGASSCPSGWSSFRSSTGSLDSTHPAVLGRNANEAVTSATAFYGGAFDTPAARHAPDTRYPFEFHELMRLDDDATATVGGTVVSADGWAQGIAIEMSPQLCAWQTTMRLFWGADVEMMTALRDASGARRGMNAVGSEGNQQLVLNVFHWLDGLTATPPVPIWERFFAQQPCLFQGQFDDDFYEPAVATPSYPPGTGPRILVDSSHANTSDLASRFLKFGELLAADGYQVEDSPYPFNTEDFDDQLEDAEILVVANPGVDILAAEFQPVVDWVRDGGKLLFVIDHTPFPARVATAAPLLGITFPVGQRVRVVPPSCLPVQFCDIVRIVWARTPLNSAEGSILEHAVTQGSASSSSDDVSVVRSYVGSAFAVVSNPPTDATYSPTLVHPATAVFHPSSQSASGLLLGLAIQLGSGRVYVSGEAAMLSAQRLGVTNVLDENGNPVLDGNGNPVQASVDKFGIQVEPGNRQYLLNVVHWLDGLL